MNGPMRGTGGLTKSRGGNAYLRGNYGAAEIRKTKPRDYLKRDRSSNERDYNMRGGTFLGGTPKIPFKWG